MLQEDVSWLWLCLSCCLLLGLWVPVEGTGAAGPVLRLTPDQVSGEAELEDWEWGSGASVLQDLLHSFPADSPFVTETPGKPANCTQRFWLPPASTVCWDDIAGPEEFAKSRLLVLQNRAALQAVSTSSGVEEGGISYDQQARDEVQGILSDHQSMAETIGTMQEVFLSLEEKRKNDKEQRLLSSMKERIASTRNSIAGKDHVAALLENQFSSLEKYLLNMQLRLSKLMAQ
ncbi:uncharacterized protein LOC115367874 [Myripristis murdjan]|uniref:uncharacterized protein LOC115367874 n=1 Tax=Myripristis murdjan TaxID=586833 RepID=UPI001176416D|nr:uncharacterized protein LOC115367874 [Myripristis murdjan]